ncbi:MAG: tRNA (5-methylaminomethyl-2-thiouridine)(34)-methyltransferase MnmD [Cyanobacterium sp.]
MEYLEKRITEDGSHTFYSQEFNETFHSKYGAKQESEITYIKGCNIKEKIAKKNHLKVIDLCYGLGYNSASLLEVYGENTYDCFLDIVALELDINVPQEAIKQNLLCFYPPSVRENLATVANTKKLAKNNLSIELIIGDARETVRKLLKENFKADAIFFDPFSPPKCPQLWTVDFFELISQCLADDGILATYSCSASVRKAMMLVGLNIGRNYTVGRRSPGTLATKNNVIPLEPLSNMELEHLETRASTPYRDPSLTDTATAIIERREKEQLSSDLKPTSQWKKKWLNFTHSFE